VQFVQRLSAARDRSTGLRGERKHVSTSASEAGTKTQGWRIKRNAIIVCNALSAQLGNLNRMVGAENMTHKRHGTRTGKFEVQNSQTLAAIDFAETIEDACSEFGRTTTIPAHEMHTLSIYRIILERT